MVTHRTGILTGMGMAAMAAALMTPGPPMSMHELRRAIARPTAKPKGLGGKSRQQRRKDERAAKTFKLKGIRP
jgi:hypothetical protein